MVLCDILQPFAGYYHGLVVTMVSKSGIETTDEFETARAAQFKAVFDGLTIKSVQTVQDQRREIALILQEQHCQETIRSTFIGPPEPLGQMLWRLDLPF